MTLLVFLALCASVVQVHVVAQQTQNNQNGGTAPTRYPSSELSEAITASSPSSFPSSSSSSSSGGCDCKCDVVKADGTKAKAEALLDGDGDAQLSCSACCKSSELLKEMSEHLPESSRTTAGGQTCKEASGILSIFLQPTCWMAPAGATCQFPFIIDNQVVIDCVADRKGNPSWCVYDMVSWNQRGEGWGYCAEASSSTTPATKKNTTTESVAPRSTARRPSGQLILTNLTRTQEEFLSASDDADFVDSVKNSDGLTSAGIAVVVVICVLVVGVLAGAGVVIWKLRNRIKQRRHQSFHNMDKGNANGREVSMTGI